MSKKIELSVEMKQSLYDRAKEITERLDVLTANQQKLRAEVIENLKNDDDLAAAADEVRTQIEGLLEELDQRAYPLLEDMFKKMTKDVSEEADNFVALQVKEQAEDARNEATTLKEEYQKVKTDFTALVTVMDLMNFDHSEVSSDLPSPSRGVGGGGNVRSANKTKTFKYYFTRNGEKEAYDNLSRALWYSSKGSNGSIKDGRLSSTEFTEIIRQTHPELMKDNGRLDWSASNWEVTLPNGTVLGFVREPLDTENKQS